MEGVIVVFSSFGDKVLNNGVRLFFYLMNRNRSCFIELKDIKERVDRSVMGGEKDKDLFIFYFWEVRLVVFIFIFVKSRLELFILVLFG